MVQIYGTEAWWQALLSGVIPMVTVILLGFISFLIWDSLKGVSR